MDTNDSVFSWNTRLSRTVMSTVQSFSFSGEANPAVGGLDDALRTLQKLNIKRCYMNDVEREGVVGEGRSFVVERCAYAGKLVAVKHLKTGESGSDGKKLGSQLSNLLLDLQIMHHKPLQSHPNILNLIGYGWNTHDNNLVPFVMVDFASMGDCRTYLGDNRGRVPFKTKLIFIGDIAAGLVALHRCGIVHGDLKLDNVLVFQSWDRPSATIAKLCDFGHSLITANDEGKLTRYYGTNL
ncbi:kinase-like protein [Wilcoxina mikolae CBS 423.85]|nr:kinase-like protein [Wilcoxina mikolae CBS 423.85]